MFAFQTPLRRTVTLVENRVKNNTSDEPLKDLAFLSDHYTAKHEWDKAHAATRHMLAVADGNLDSVFQTTPIDLELHQTKKYLSRRKRLRFWSVLTFWCTVLFGICYSINCGVNANPQIILDLRAQFFPTDSQTFQDRFAYFYNKGMLTEAKAECEKALKLDPANPEALHRKSLVLYCMGNYQESLQTNSLSSKKNGYFYSNQARVQEASGNNKDAALSHESAYNTDKYAEDLCWTAYAAASAGDFEKALRFAKLETTTSKNNYRKAEGLSQEARYLLRMSHYREAIDAATKSIALTSTPLIARAYTYRAEGKYNLSLYQEAADDATQAILFDNSDYRALEVRAKCFEMMGRTSDAKADRHLADVNRNGRDI